MLRQKLTPYYIKGRKASVHTKKQKKVRFKGSINHYKH